MVANQRPGGAWRGWLSMIGVSSGKCGVVCDPTTDERLVSNRALQHPSTHGVPRLLLVRNEQDDVSRVHSMADRAERGRWPRRHGVNQIWTAGHWTCPESTFIGLLREQQIELVADVRSYPGSRTSPQFSKDTMHDWLDHAGIGYVHLDQLGGRRPKQDVDPQMNAGWRQRSFKNYADYTLSTSYEDGIARLIALATHHRVAYLCAEPMPWRCHRLLVSNTLTVRGFTVWHILAAHTTRQHRMGDWGAQPSIDAAGRLIYPEPGASRPRSVASGHARASGTSA